MIDGHGGNKNRVFLEKNLVRVVAKHPKLATGDYKAVLVDSIMELDKMWYDEQVAKVEAGGKHCKSGSCICMCIVAGNQVTVANVGDCRMVRYAMGQPPQQITRDHKPDDDEEKARVEKAGGEVIQKMQTTAGCLCIKPRTFPIGPHRVMPCGLAVARSVGDVQCKYERFGAQVEGTVVCEPELHELTLDHADEYLILATDGVWDIAKTGGEVDNNKYRKTAQTEIMNIIKERTNSGKIPFECVA